jgi:hypothetical protein
MSLALGRPSFINLKECTVTPPLDCKIPIDRFKTVPTARSDFDKPTPMTERLLRFKMSLRGAEIRDLELQGPMPQNPEKVKELDQFAMTIRNSLPSFFHGSSPDYTWDAECPFIPTHRELTSYLIDSFLMALHRPYIFKRERSQIRVYKSALSILDSQERLFQSIRNSRSSFYIGSTFPTFDAAILLAVVLVSNPERYHKSFQRPYRSLKRAVERLEFIGANMTLAKVGAEILETTICRVIEAQEKAGFPWTGLQDLPGDSDTTRSKSSSLSPGAEPWDFEFNETTMDWITQNDEFAPFDFSNLKVPMPLKELLLDQETFSGFWDPTTVDDLHGITDMNETMGLGDNELWNFLAGYSTNNGT